MKTIEERAKEYVDRHKAMELACFGMSKLYGYTRVYNAEITAYEWDAKEQKVIDDAELRKLKSSQEKEAQINHDDEANYKQGYHDAINKACELLKAMGVLTDDDSIMGFIKAMEE